MKTFDELRLMLTGNLLELRTLEASRFTTIEERHTREQEIGRRGVEAEEDLGTLELNTLKRTVGLSDIDQATIWLIRMFAASCP